MRQQHWHAGLSGETAVIADGPRKGDVLAKLDALEGSAGLTQRVEAGLYLVAYTVNVYWIRNDDQLRKLDGRGGS